MTSLNVQWKHSGGRAAGFARAYKFFTVLPFHALHTLSSSDLSMNLADPMSALLSKADIVQRGGDVRLVPLTEVGSPSSERPQDSELTLPHGLHRLIYGSYRIDSEVAFYLEPFPRFIRSRS